MTAQQRLLRMPAVCDKIGISRAEVYRWIEAGRIPRPVRLSKQSVAFPEAEIDAVVAGLIAERDTLIAQHVK